MKMSLRSYLDNKAAVPPSPVPPFLLVWACGSGRNYVVCTGCVGPGVLREDRIAKAMSRRAQSHESDCLSSNPDSATTMLSVLGTTLNRLNLRRLQLEP